MSRFMSVAVAAALFASSAFAAAPEKPIALKGEKQAAVTFNHSSHKALKCTACHKDDKGGKIEGLEGNMANGHKACQTCHKEEVAKNASSKAPTKCTECHKKA